MLTDNIGAHCLLKAYAFHFVTEFLHWRMLWSKLLAFLNLERVIEQVCCIASM